MDRRDEMTREFVDLVIDFYPAGRRGDPLSGRDRRFVEQCGGLPRIAYFRGLAARREIVELNDLFHVGEPGFQSSFPF